MAPKRPYKVDFHYDGSKYTDEDGNVRIDKTKPINARHSFPDIDRARSLAQDIAQRGGRATLSHVDADTGKLLTFEVFEPKSDDIRSEFVDAFLSYADFGGDDPMDKTMEELLDIWDIELNAAKVKWPSIDLGTERSNLDDWLSQRGYTYPERDN